MLIGTGARGTVAPGYARPYDLIDGLFTQPVPDISGGGGDVSGRYREMERLGAPANSDNGDEAGKVIVYRLGEREQDSDEDGVADVDDAFPLDASRVLIQTVMVLVITPTLTMMVMASRICWTLSRSMLVRQSIPTLMASVTMLIMMMMVTIER